LHARTLASRSGPGRSIVQLAPMPSATGAARAPERAFDLSPRQAQICQLLAAGHSEDQIAATLGISHWTVRAHLRKVFIKFDVANRIELARMLMTARR
jgi:DNA-binding CsgD family transcriptional regulator